MGYRGSLPPENGAHRPEAQESESKPRSTWYESPRLGLWIFANQLHSTDVLVVQLKKAELNDLAQKTRLIINCVGPYNLYSSPVVEACAINGTHYLDV